ncbi:MAG: ATP-binding protein [Candidatus Acidiferrales bacterium]
MSRAKAWVSWSSGKDSAWALHEVRRRSELDVTALLTTVNATHSRVAMHAVRESVLEAQAVAAGLPLVKVPIPSPCPNEVYEAAMREAMARAHAEGVTHIVFGDLFLEDVRRYREEKLDGTGIAPVFPLWGRDTAELAREMIAAGVQAVLTCVDPKKLPRAFAGRWFDSALLAHLPAGVDRCGENGEFHTCVVAGPMFAAELGVTVGETVERDGFVFSDVLLRDKALRATARSD